MSRNLHTLCFGDQGIAGARPAPFSQSAGRKPASVERNLLRKMIKWFPGHTEEWVLNLLSWDWGSLSRPCHRVTEVPPGTTDTCPHVLSGTRWQQPSSALRRLTQQPKPLVVMQATMLLTGDHSRARTGPWAGVEGASLNSFLEALKFPLTQFMSQRAILKTWVHHEDS